MPRVKLGELKKGGEFFKKLPRFLSANAFFVSLILISIASILGVLIFYKYSFLAERKEPEIEEQPMILDEKILQEVLEIRQERQKRLEEAEFKEYPNPFLID